MGQSQNPSQLRTQKGEKRGSESEPESTSDTNRRKPGSESELRSTSDTKRRKTWVRVRTRVNFGHKKEETLDLSQNPGQLRTQKGGNPGFESEPGSTSDTERKKTWI